MKYDKPLCILRLRQCSLCLRFWVLMPGSYSFGNLKLVSTIYVIPLFCKDITLLSFDSPRNLNAYRSYNNKILTSLHIQCEDCLKRRIMFTEQYSSEEIKFDGHFYFKSFVK